MTEILAAHNLAGQGAEVGCHRGRFAGRVLSQWPGRLFLIDAWQHLDEYDDVTNGSDEEHEECYRETLAAMAPYADRCTILRMLSSEAAGIIPDASLDWVYIDANHSYEAVKCDLRLWLPKLKEGGLFSGHDYLDGTLPEGVFGVKRAVDEFAGKHVNVVDGQWPSWWFIK